MEGPLVRGRGVVERARGLDGRREPMGAAERAGRGSGMIGWEGKAGTERWHLTGGCGTGNARQTTGQWESASHSRAGRVYRGENGEMG